MSKFKEPLPEKLALGDKLYLCISVPIFGLTDGVCSVYGCLDGDMALPVTKTFRSLILILVACTLLLRNKVMTQVGTSI